MTDITDGLLAMRKRHGADSLIGDRCTNLVQKMKAHADCQDPVRRAWIEKNMRREIAEIAELQRR